MKIKVTQVYKSEGKYCTHEDVESIHSLEFVQGVEGVKMQTTSGFGRAFVVPSGGRLEIEVHNA